MQKLHASAEKLKETIGQFILKHNPKSIYRKDDRSSYEQLLSGMYPLRTKAKDLDAIPELPAKALGFGIGRNRNWQCCGGVYPLGSTRSQQTFLRPRFERSEGKGDRTS